jgi:excisionase family DNA binding protein
MDGKYSKVMKLLDVSQLSEMLNVKKKTIYDWVHKNKIPYLKLGNLVRFNPNDIDQWLKSKKHKKKTWKKFV